MSDKTSELTIYVIEIAYYLYRQAGYPHGETMTDFDAWYKVNIVGGFERFAKEQDGINKTPSIGQYCLVWDIDYLRWIIAAWVRVSPDSNEGQFEDLNDLIDQKERRFRVVRWGTWRPLPPDWDGSNGTFR